MKQIIEILNSVLDNKSGYSLSYFFDCVLVPAGTTSLKLSHLQFKDLLAEIAWKYSLADLQWIYFFKIFVTEQ